MNIDVDLTEAEQFKKDIDELYGHIENADIKTFYIKMYELIDRHKYKSPLLNSIKRDLRLSKASYNYLNKEYDNGILNHSQILVPRTRILKACFKSTELLEREINLYLKNKKQIYANSSGFSSHDKELKLYAKSVEEKGTEIEIHLGMNVNENEEKTTSNILKITIDGKLNVKITPTYTKQGSIKLGFKIPYNLDLMRKLIPIVDNLSIRKIRHILDIIDDRRALDEERLIMDIFNDLPEGFIYLDDNSPKQGFVTLKFNDTLIQSYFDTHNLKEYMEEIKKFYKISKNVTLTDAEIMENIRVMIDDNENTSDIENSTY